ncbi:MAG: SCP2 sterol-binding domain-containing protein [Thermoproteus sp.]
MPSNSSAFRPTQDWLAEVCRSISAEKAPPELSIVATEVPWEPSGHITLYFRFEDGRCIEARLLQGKIISRYTLSARYEDLLGIMEGRLSPFAAVPLGKLKIEKGTLGELADYMPLALEIVEAARGSAKKFSHSS